ncbi:Hypothetical_protein [Hexamita inflata]|uniref:Hypothetical_protein n=1 Tax=Hexamita inflata TaxID=28002 RepID=A0AA86TJU0_9EUKA|nr:Hypothetical protein HINF_LOCUS8549 [Hexamita inflata]
MSLITIIIHSSIALVANAVERALAIHLQSDATQRLFTHLQYNIVFRGRINTTVLFICAVLLLTHSSPTQYLGYSLQLSYSCAVLSLQLCSQLYRFLLKMYFRALYSFFIIYSHRK